MKIELKRKMSILNKNEIEFLIKIAKHMGEETLIKINAKRGTASINAVSIENVEAICIDTVKDKSVDFLKIYSRTKYNKDKNCSTVCSIELREISVEVESIEIEEKERKLYAKE